MRIFNATPTNTLRPIPGMATSEKQVLKLSLRYPWLWNELFPFYKTDEGLRDERLKVLEVIWEQDRPVLEGLLRNDLQGIFSVIDPNQNPIKQPTLRDPKKLPIVNLNYLLEQLKKELRIHHFGTVDLYNAVQQGRGGDRSSSFHSADEVTHISNRLKMNGISSGLCADGTYSEIHAEFFFLARILYPERYGYLRPKIFASEAPCLVPRFISTVGIVHRPMMLSAEALFSIDYGEIENWLKLIRNLDQKLLADSKIYIDILQHARSHLPSHWALPIEITFIDPTISQIKSVIEELLRATWGEGNQPVFGGNRIRVVVMTTRESEEKGFMKKAAILEYQIRPTSQDPTLREAIKGEVVMNPTIPWISDFVGTII